APRQQEFFQRPVNQLVVGSNPTRGAENHNRKAAIFELTANVEGIVLGVSLSRNFRGILSVLTSAEFESKARYTISRLGVYSPPKTAGTLKLSAAAYNGVNGPSTLSTNPGVSRAAETNLRDRPMGLVLKLLRRIYRPVAITSQL